MVGPVFEAKSLGWPSGYAAVSPAERTHCLARVTIQPSCHDGSRTARKFILSRPGAF